MNIYKLSLAGINVNEGIKRFNGNAAIYEKFLKKFSDDVNYSALCESIKEKNATETFKATHALKGVAGNLSITELYADLSPLVEELRKDSIENAENLLVPISKDYAKVIAALKEETL